MMVLLGGVGLGVWWLIGTREQPPATPLSQAAVPPTPEGAAIPEPRTSAEAKPETPHTKNKELDKDKAAPNSPLPPAIPKPQVSGTPGSAEAKQNSPENAKHLPDNPKSFLSLRALAKEFLESFEKWRKAIVDPRQFLQPGFEPTEDELVEGTEFYLTVFSVSFIFFAPLALTYKGETADKTKVAVNGALGLMFTGILAMTWYFAFWLMGGKSTISGTFLAYIYAAGPYLPLFAVLSLLIFAGLPERYRRAALNPATAQAAMNEAIQDSETSKGPVLLGGCGAMAIMMWSMIVVFRCFSYVHDVHAWKLTGAILVSLVLAAPVSLMLKKLSALIQGTPGISDKLGDGL